jgi:hypothetical protein
MAERHRQGDLQLMVELVHGNDGRERGQALELIFSAAPNFAFWFEAMKAIALPHLGVGNGHSEGYQVGMFIDQVQVVEDTEEIAVPSIVWLQRGYSRTDSSGNFLAFSSQGSFEAREVIAMREIRLFRRFTRKHGAATDRLIERGSQVVEGVCCGEPQVAGQWLREFEACLQVPRLRVNVGSRSYQILQPFQGLMGCAEIRNVLFGPFNL